MRIEAVQLTEIELPMKFAFRTSTGVTTKRRILLLKLVTDRGDGVAECVAGEEAGYTYETVDTAWIALQQMIIPAVLGQAAFSPADLLRRLAHIRGHDMAKAALENAWWDAWARAADVPLWQLLGGVTESVPVGVAVGMQPSVAETLEQVDSFVAAGYRRVKLKVAPGWDVQPIRHVREKHPDVSLTVDANSAYTTSDARALRELDSYGLDYVEQPLAYDDLHDHAALQAMLSTPLCLDESIRSPADARKALAIGACQVINVKIGRVGGLLPARQIHDVAEAFGAPVWCGGMLETGLGRAYNIALSTLPGFTLPGDTASSSRYWARDIVCEAIEADNGQMRVPAGVGTGVTVDWDFVDSVKLREQTFTRT